MESTNGQSFHPIVRGSPSIYIFLILSVSMAVFNVFLMRLGLDCSRFGSCFFARKDFPCGARNRMQDKILFRQLRFSLFSSARYFDICLRRFLSEEF